MRAIILAAGYGRRMRPLSDECHKALLPIGGTTILARIVEELLATDVSAIHVVTGYRAREVEDYLRTTFPGAEVRFVRNDRYATTNNIVSLALALEEVDPGEDVLLVECDLLLAPGLLARAAAGRNVALVDRYRTGMDGTVVTVSNRIVTAVIPPHLQGDGFAYRGTYKTLNVYRFTHQFVDAVLRPRVCDHARLVDSGAYYETVLAGLPDLARHGIEADLVDGESWAEVDDPNDLAEARFRFEPHARADILDRTMGGQWGFDVIDFAHMRNAYFPTDAMLAALRHSLADVLAGYGSAQPVLDEKVAWFVGCAPERIEVLHGGTQAFPILGELWAGRTAAIPAPTFGEYRRMFPGARTYADGPGVDLGELDALAQSVDVVVVVNPNNPTGTTLPTAELRALAARHPATTFLLDESFVDFSDEPSILPALERDPLPNVLVLCSLSKSLGVPGLRLGYVYGGDRALLDAIAARLPIWNLGSLTEHFVELLLKFRPELEESLRRTKADREALRAALRRIPAVADVHPSGGNFLLVRLHGEAGAADRLRRALLAGDAPIEIKDVSAKLPGRGPHLRLAVRRPEDNARLVAALERHA